MTAWYRATLLLAAGLAPACRRPGPPPRAVFHVTCPGMPVEITDTTGVDVRAVCGDSAARPARRDSAAADAAPRPTAPNEALQPTGLEEHDG